jgi:cytochrome b involved in lipid metabolism
MIFRGEIYDITHYLDFHPGGSEKLMLAAGKDGTSLFRKILGF